MAARRVWFARAVALVVVALAAWFVGRTLHADLPRLMEAVEAPGPLFFVGVAAAFLLMAWFPLVWWFVLRGVGISMPLRETYPTWWLSNLGKYIPGKAWMVAGRVYLGRRWGRARVLESMAWEFVVGVGSALIAGSMYFLHAGPLGWLAPVVLAGAALALVPLAWPGVVRRVLRAPLRRLGKGDWIGEVRMDRGHLFAALAVATLGWFGWGVAHSFMLAGIGLEVAFWAVTGGYALAWAMGYVILVLPAGLGAREWGIQVLLAAAMVPGAAALFAVVSRTVMLLAEVGAFLVATVWVGAGKTKQGKTPETVPD